MRSAFILVLLGYTIAGGADRDYESARRKIDMIEEDRATPGSRIWLSLQELNAYARQEAQVVVPQGLREIQLTLGAGAASGSALADLLKIRALKGPPPGGLLGWFLSGERPVRVKAKIQSGQGRATVFVEQVTISGITASGPVLQFLIDNFLLPLYPEAKIGRPFQLKHNVDRLEIAPAGVNVVIAGKPATR